VTLRPGQSAVVHFSVPASSLAFWDTTAQGWVTAPGTYQVYAGDSSALGNLPLRGQFSLGGR
jgi:beta-glucosidase